MSLICSRVRTSGTGVCEGGGLDALFGGAGASVAIGGYMGVGATKRVSLAFTKCGYSGRSGRRSCQFKGLCHGGSRGDENFV